MAFLQAKSCKTCFATKKLPFIVTKTIVFPRVLLESRTKKDRREEVTEFLHFVNALMNEGAGIVCIHADNPYLLGQLDELVDNRMRELIPDGSSFEENFERYFHKDKRHVIFKVRPRVRPFCTLDFKTKVSLNKGLTDPIHEEMRRYINLLSREEEPEDNVRDETSQAQMAEFEFASGEEVQHETSVFAESMHVQAKRIPDLNLQNSDKVTAFVEYCWNQGKLPLYISAFSKLRKGGSVYYGLHETKTVGNPQWHTVDRANYENVINVVDASWSVWKDDNNSNVYHVAQECDVPKKWQEKTGKYTCEGIVLTEDEQTEIRAQILRKIGDEMYWHPASESETPSIDVEFLEVHRGNPDLRVVKVTVKKFNGLSFYHKLGPESYKVSTRNRIASVSRFELEEWVENNFLGLESKSTSGNSDS